MTLYKTLKEHFDKAADKYPVANQLFQESVQRSKECLSNDALVAKFIRDPFYMKGICYQVGKIERSFEEGEQIVKCFWDAHDIVRKHKGPII